MTGRRWPDAVDEVLGGDQVVALAYVTPASGVVLTPVTNFGLRDRDAGTLTAVNSSVGAPRKLERIERNPRVALAYHSRAHAFTDRPEYVLVQGTASLSDPIPDYPRTIRDAWERFGGPVEVGRLWDWWLRVYSLRVAITIAVERILVWPDLRCDGEPAVFGAPLPPEPQPQDPPRKGTGPRVNHARVARRAARLPHVLLGWVGGDGFPLAAPVGVDGTEDAGLALRAPAGLVPPGSRRAGLLAHWFARYTAGQRQRIHTGWLESDPEAGRLVYAPHTEVGYRMPASMFVYRLSAGAVTRWHARRGGGWQPSAA